MNESDCITKATNQSWREENWKANKNIHWFKGSSTFEFDRQRNKDRRKKISVSVEKGEQSRRQRGQQRLGKVDKKETK